LLRGMSPYHRRLLQAVLLKDFYEEVDGRRTASVTAAFWDRREHLAAAEPWDV
jgi:hypothetical protein